MKRLIFGLALAVGTLAPAQALHVTGVHDWQPTDAPRVSQVRVMVVSGTIGDMRYTAQQMFTFGSQRFDVGTDYPATLSKDGRALNVLMKDKRGHDVKERLDVTGTEEAH